MKNLFDRIRDNVLADLHSTLDEKERKSPIALLNQHLRDCEREVKKIESLIHRQQQLKSQFYREKEQAYYLASKRTRQIDIARHAGETELEQRATEEAAYYTEQSERLTEMHTTTEKQVYELQAKLEEMRRKLKEMNAKRLELMSRENVAHTHRKINDALYKLSENNPFLKFEEIEQQISDIETRVNSDYARDSFDHRMEKLEREQKDSLNLTK